MVGTGWRIIRGGGCVVGKVKSSEIHWDIFIISPLKVDKSGELTGDNIAYIYPDYRSVILRIVDDQTLLYVSELLWLESLLEVRWRLGARRG